MYCDGSCVSSPSLGVEPVDKDVMSRPPRKATDRMVTLPLLFQIVTTSLTIVAGTLWVFRKEVVQLYLLIYASMSTSVLCTIYMYIIILLYTCFNLMRDEKEERKKQARSNKAKQHSTPKAVTFNFVAVHVV